MYLTLIKSYCIQYAKDGCPIWLAWWLFWAAMHFFVFFYYSLWMKIYLIKVQIKLLLLLFFFFWLISFRGAKFERLCEQCNVVCKLAFYVICDAKLGHLIKTVASTVCYFLSQISCLSLSEAATVLLWDSYMFVLETILCFLHQFEKTFCHLS